MLRTELYRDPRGRSVHDLILESCHRFPQKTAIVDTSSGRRISYAEYGELVESLARGWIAAGLRPGEVVAIYLSNCWQFCASYHAATLAGAIPTFLNPSFREREVRYQLANSGAAMLLSEGGNISGMDLSGLPNLRRVYALRQIVSGTQPFADLLQPAKVPLPEAARNASETIGALPYSSGTTGLPKGVMLSHFNLVANIFQYLGPHTSALTHDSRVLCFLPLYHIYGLNVMLNPVLSLGATLVLLPRFQVTQVTSLLLEENITIMPTVPPALVALSQAAEAGQFPKNHQLGWVKSGAAPLSRGLARRFTSLTGIPVCQGYGMTEASPVTHIGYLEDELYRPESIGQPIVQTECRVVDEKGGNVALGNAGELVMRGPQFMLGYWGDPAATAAVMRDGWYWSGDIVSCDAANFFYVLDRRKEMIKYKGFPIAPAEVESVLLEHPEVSECGVVGRKDSSAGEIPVAFVVLRHGSVASEQTKEALCGFVADRLTHYKQPREILFVEAIPKTASGKILRKELRKSLG
ncbi:MAG TPA: AMP-binding protein [Terriglobales bacterium]|nr:AMP-binding protein [Terriglobales bacterium]